MTHRNGSAGIAGLALIALLALPTAAQDPLLVSHHYELFLAGTTIEQADMDMDGHVDLIAKDYSKLRWFPNLGDGRFVNDEANDLPIGGLDFTVADVDNDGDPDIVQTSIGNTVWVAINGHTERAPFDATFDRIDTYTVTDNAGQVDIVDLNFDGWPDLAVGNDAGPRVAVLLNAGDGTFLPAVNYGPTGARPTAVGHGTLDANPSVDLVFANFYDDFVSILFNDGSGGFAGAPLVLPTLLGPEAVATGDLDEDGDQDLVVLAGAHAQIYFGDGLGGFAAPLDITIGAAGEGLEIFDLDEDGHLDVLAAANARATLIRGHGDGTFDAPVAHAVGGSMTDLAVADYDHDGEWDIAAVDFGLDGLDVVFGDGTGGFGPHMDTGWWPLAVALDDFDGDGVLDIATCNELDETVSILLGRGNARFAPAVDYPGGTKIQDMVARDFDGNGTADLLTMSGTLFGGKLNFLSGAGDGTFAAPVVSVVANDLRAMAVGHLDGDNALDVVVAANGLNSAYVAHGRGDGTFGFVDAYPAWLAPEDVVVADFDGDLDDDFATVNWVSSDAIQVFLNNGAGFDAPLPVATNVVQYDIQAEDLDGNGTMDLIGVGNGVSVFRGNGDGSFGPAETYAAGYYPKSVAIGDVDNDDVLDLVVAHEIFQFDEGSVGVFPGNGDGTFGAMLEFETTGDLEHLALGDMNGDGVLDVVAPSALGSLVTVMTSRRGPWDSLGSPLAGTLGLPHQTGEGTLVPFEPFRFTLSDALPFSSAWHFVGLSRIDAPFKGGTMVPALTLINGPLPIDGQGELVLAGPWPPGLPSGFEIYLQFWVLDPGGPVGFSASDGLKATMP